VISHVSESGPLSFFSLLAWSFTMRNDRIQLFEIG
jgi:hypothetical protein